MNHPHVDLEGEQLACERLLLRLGQVRVQHGDQITDLPVFLAQSLGGSDGRSHNSFRFFGLTGDFLEHDYSFLLIIDHVNYTRNISGRDGT